MDDQLRIVHVQMQMLEAVQTELAHERIYRRGTVAVANCLLGTAATWIVLPSDVVSPAPMVPSETPAPPNMTRPEMQASTPAEMTPPPHAQTPAATSLPKSPKGNTAASPAAHALRLLFLRDLDKEDKGEDEVEKEEVGNKNERGETTKHV